jgi:hypothetical protein
MKLPAEPNEILKVQLDVEVVELEEPVEVAAPYHFSDAISTDVLFCSVT